MQRLQDNEARKARIDEMFEDYKEDFPQTPYLTVEEYLALKEAGTVVLVDVRESEEQQVSMIPGALTSAEFEDRRDEYVDAKVVAYCTIGYRSGVYAQKLREEGFDAHNLKGSILSWAHAGRPLIDSEAQSTRRLHVYGADWDLAPLDYEAVY